MTSPSEPRTSRLYHARQGTAFAPHGAIALALAAVATMLVVGIGAATAGLPLFGAVALGQLAMALAVVVVNRRVGGGLRTLGLRTPSRRAVVGAVLLGCTFWYINMTVVSLLPLPSAEDSPLQQLVNVPPLWGALLAIAVVPAVCEELVFRGVLVRSIVGPWSVGFAVIVSAAMFAAYHLSILQLVPTFLLGLVLALVAVCSDSAIPTMIAHFLNNAIALTIARGELPGVASVLREHPTLALAGAILASAAGLGLATSRPVPGRGA